MAGSKTHEQHLRILERKDDLPKAREVEDEDVAERAKTDPGPFMQDRDARQSEFPISRHGMHQESQHNKHNDPGQSGHKPQKRNPEEEGHGSE